jgi:hypothetical protein
MVKKYEAKLMLSRAQMNKLKKGLGVVIKMEDVVMEGGFLGSIVRAVAPTLIREGSKFAGEQLARKVEGGAIPPMKKKRDIPAGLRAYIEAKKGKPVKKGEGVVGDLFKKVRKPLGGLAKKGVKYLGEMAADKLGDIVEKQVAGEGMMLKPLGKKGGKGFKSLDPAYGVHGGSFRLPM